MSWWRSRYHNRSGSNNQGCVTLKIPGLSWNSRGVTLYLVSERVNDEQGLYGMIRPGHYWEAGHG